MEIRKILELMEQETSDIKHPKGWGYELWPINNSLYCLKYLVVEKDKQCSLHYHKIKDETFTVLDGLIELEIFPRDEKLSYHTPTDHLHLSFRSQQLERLTSHLGTSITYLLKPPQQYHITPLTPHRFRGLEDFNVIQETSTHHEDSDSYRLIKGD